MSCKFLLICPWIKWPVPQAFSLCPLGLSWKRLVCVAGWSGLWKTSWMKITALGTWVWEVVQQALFTCGIPGMATLCLGALWPVMTQGSVLCQLRGVWSSEWEWSLLWREHNHQAGPQYLDHTLIKLGIVVGGNESAGGQLFKAQNEPGNVEEDVFHYLNCAIQSWHCQWLFSKMTAWYEENVWVVDSLEKLQCPLMRPFWHLSNYFGPKS